jgi:hypothetical protein
MVNIVIICIITTHNLQRVEWEYISAMIIHSFECRERKKYDHLPDCHEGARLPQDSAYRIEQETFDGVVI